jgi:hypothetical protein
MLSERACSRQDYPDSCGDGPERYGVEAAVPDWRSGPFAPGAAAGRWIWSSVGPSDGEFLAIDAFGRKAAVKPDVRASASDPSGGSPNLAVSPL